MFDTSIHKTELNTPATGVVQKSNSMSFFIRMHQDGKYSQKLYGDKPEYNDKPVRILQMMATDRHFIVEIVYVSDLKEDS